VYSKLRKILRIMSAVMVFATALVASSSSQASAPCARGACSNAGGNSVARLAPVLYTAIDGHTETLTPWQGTHVSVLVEAGVERDAKVMGRLVDALDRAWVYYEVTTGRTPGIGHSLNGRDEIAEVTSTCGAGCTYLGATGTEIQTYWFDLLYRQIAEGNVYDQVPFYELGRSFWFWSSQLQFQAPDQDPVVTGFAVWMRFRSMEAAHVKGAPFNGVTPFGEFASQIEALAGQYEADPSLTFAETLAQDKSPGAIRGHGLLGVADDAARRATRRTDVRGTLLAARQRAPRRLLDHRSGDQLGERRGLRRVRRSQPGVL
jgi:hypothetical protein